MNKENKLSIKYVSRIVFFILAFSVLFIYISRHVSGVDILTFDQTIITFVQSFISDQLTGLMVAVSFLGSIKFITSSIIVLSILLLLNKKWALVFFLMGSSGIGALLNKLLKWYFKRERPDILPLIEESGYSFPSGHSMGSLIFYGSLAYICIHIVKSTNKKIFSVTFFALIILFIGISRIYLGVHYPTDVVGGFSIGISYLFICILGFRYYEAKKHK